VSIADEPDRSFGACAVVRPDAESSPFLGVEVVGGAGVGLRGLRRGRGEYDHDRSAGFESRESPHGPRLGPCVDADNRVESTSMPCCQRD
jgi:hypothetical protein